MMIDQILIMSRPIISVSIDICILIRLSPFFPITSFLQSEFLSSDSDSEEEENINFVEMWKAREASSPMKLPDWNPQKSVEEHRKKVRRVSF